ncbi:hypothetical protein E4T66_21000 [Sinimarinibacterium sp. CAU 1509]|uniref:hypothetical protein n=1 Tax=Sinimarinibacterium sp. CAU 1509 TaxID=2562283 RepID=UPI0010AD715E|nr:hypothetical protein [Sinimarinibacterium sp. CAU 1509]TJY55311.1 hypothetical protein E4T66_21000 [Sinimarinibacterium sp. CAU 1509]
MDDMEQIEAIESWDSGGGILLDIVRLRDGTILAISDEAIVLYADEEDLVAGDAVERPMINRPLGGER